MPAALAAAAIVPHQQRQPRTPPAWAEGEWAEPAVDVAILPAHCAVTPYDDAAPDAADAARAADDDAPRAEQVFAKVSLVDALNLQPTWLAGRESIEVYDLSDDGCIDCITLISQSFSKSGRNSGEAAVVIEARLAGLEISKADVCLGEVCSTGEERSGGTVSRHAVWQGRDVIARSQRPSHAGGGLCLVAAYREIVLLRSFQKHPNLLELLGCDLSTPAEPLIVMECTGGSLEDLVTTFHAGVPRPQLLRLALDVARGIAHLHASLPPLIHRNVKPSNIFLDARRQTAKLGNFGLARVFPSADLQQRHRMTGVTGALRYMAPEVFRDEPYNASVDVYSWAIVAMYMLRGTPPFKGEGSAGMLRVHHQTHARPLPPIWRPLKVLVKRAWAERPDSRPTAKTLVKCLVELCNRTDAETAPPCAAACAHNEAACAVM
ncbi:kinase-like domain-containing protein [Pelagophyceae sp. CCMP2097]|nr:kinase-like domain-containing protein [Pelagophyceae sp. CCMP2097]